MAVSTWWTAETSRGKLLPGEKPQVRWDRATYGDCPSPPDLAKFSAHGLNLRSADNGADTLYMVNHGGRKFDRDFCARPQRSRAECRVGRLRGNAGTYLAELGGAAAGWRHSGDRHVRPQDPKAADKLAAGEDTGAVYEWHPHTGFTLVPDSKMSGDNGIEVSRDGKWIYVAAWGNKAVVRLSRGSGSTAKREMLPVGFLADNLRWAPDGQLIVAGQNVSAKDVFGCFQSKAPRCTQPWRIDRRDTAAMSL